MIQLIKLFEIFRLIRDTLYSLVTKLLKHATKGNKMLAQKIPGYTMGTNEVQKSPVNLSDLESLKKALIFNQDDVKYLKMSKEILKDQVEAILDVWYGFVGSTPELLQYFKNVKTGEPDGNYLNAVRKRFGQWILDTADANYDQKWLDYQYEIGLRHAPNKKNKTDQVQSMEFINFRYIIALTIPVTTTLRPFLSKQGVSIEEVDHMHSAWVKSVLLQTILWSHPYIKEPLF